jgi:hypothetical protein
MRVSLLAAMSLMVGVTLLNQGVALAEISSKLVTTSKIVSTKVLSTTNKTTTNKKGTSLFRHSTYPAAWTAAQESNRPILIYVTMPQCPHCVKMIEQTYKRPTVGKIVSSSFETICADRFIHAKLIEKLHVKWYPTTILVSPNNKVLDVIEGYVDEAKFKQHLQTGLAAAGQVSQTR